MSNTDHLFTLLSAICPHNYFFVPNLFYWNDFNSHENLIKSDLFNYIEFSLTGYLREQIWQGGGRWFETSRDHPLVSTYKKPCCITVSSCTPLSSKWGRATILLIWSILV